MGSPSVRCARQKESEKEKDEEKPTGAIEAPGVDTTISKLKPSYDLAKVADKLRDPNVSIEDKQIISSAFMPASGTRLQIVSIRCWNEQGCRRMF